MKKKTLSLILALTLVLSLVLSSCGGGDDPVAKKSSEPEEQSTTNGNEENKEEVLNQLIIGDTNEASGDWSGIWQNNGADALVRDLVSGYVTVYSDANAKFHINETIVKEYKARDNEDGTRTHTFTLNLGHKYASGKEITVDDYIASFLLGAAKVMGSDEGMAGGKNTAGDILVGQSEYSKGEAENEAGFPVFKGVRKLSDDTFELTVTKEKTPNFFELAYVGSNPMPMWFWLGENVEIKDDGEGCYFAKDINTEEYAKKILAARDIPTYYSTGAYKIESYDKAQSVITLVAVPEYTGDHAGRTAKIEKLIIKKVSQKTSMDDLKTGGVDMLREMMSGTEINGGLELVDAGGFSYTDYPRAGYGKLDLVCDFGPTQFVEVRQALAHLLDRNDFAKQFTGGYGTIVHAPYGESHWFYQESKKELNDKLNPYSYDPKKAEELLVAGGWTLDKDGKEFKGEGLRHKKLEDGTLMPLSLKWASSEGNAVSELLVIKLQQNPALAELGMEIKQDLMTFPELLSYLYRDGSENPKYAVPTYHMYNLATGFVPVYDQTKYYSQDEDLLKQGWNYNYILDDELEETAKSIVLRTSDDTEGFKADFVKFASKWNELIPSLPLYSNQIHDFYNDKLKGYEKTSLQDFSDAILNAHVE